MSKTTSVLVVVLFLFLGVLGFTLYGPKQSHIIDAFMNPTATPPITANTQLSLSTNTHTVAKGQTVTVSVLIHNPNPTPDLVQLELAYNPAVVTIETISPGTFFKHSDVALQTIDPIEGRITYALRCPTSKINCENTSSHNLATITMRVNPYALHNKATLTFLPKSLVRTHGGSNILKKTNGLKLLISQPLIPVSVPHTIASPAATVMPTATPAITK